MFHRIDDMYTLNAPRFLRLVLRLPAYEGVLRARAAAEAAEERGHSPARPAGRPSRGGMTYDQPTEVTPVAAAKDPVMASLISWGSGPG